MGWQNWRVAGGFAVRRSLTATGAARAFSLASVSGTEVLLVADTGPDLTSYPAASTLVYGPTGVGKTSAVVANARRPPL